MGASDNTNLMINCKCTVQRLLPQDWDGWRRWDGDVDWAAICGSGEELRGETDPCGPKVQPQGEDRPPEHGGAGSLRANIALKIMSKADEPQIWFQRQCKERQRELFSKGK